MRESSLMFTGQFFHKVLISQHSIHNWISYPIVELDQIPQSLPSFVASISITY